MLQRASGNKPAGFKKLEPNPRECGVVWTRTTKDGKNTYLSGKLTITQQLLDRIKTAEVDKHGNKVVNFCAFTAEKFSENSPDYKIVLNKED